MDSIFIGMENVSLVDYEGKIACSLFVGGCNFMCPFCHNSELVLRSHEYQHIKEEDIFTYLESRKKVLDAVVISGGEPTMYNTLPDFIRKVKDMGFLVKLDTNGTNPDMIKYLVQNDLIDYIAMDIKNSKTKYPLTAGVNNLTIHNIEKSVEYIMSCGIDYEFRTTLVAGHHTAQDMQEIAEWLTGAKHLFLQHFDDKGANIQAGLTVIDKTTALRFAEILKQYIQNVILRGYN
ncbi:MAG: anaerobic ribonucleoside-triphosphate reductase activating protein [Clostridia bacterium]